MTRRRYQQRMKFGFSAADVPISTRLVLIAICHHAGEDGIYRGGHALLAEALGQGESSAKTVQRAIANLIKAGYIDRTNEPHRGQNPHYRIRFE